MSGRRFGILPALAATLLAIGCGDPRDHRQSVCALIDVSGTYADQRAEVASLIKRQVLPELLPGDTLLVIRIDNQSYEKDNVEVLVTLDDRPSRANAQKLAAAKRLDAFAAAAAVSEYTDIHGALMLGAEYLREIGAGSRVMLVFSDLDEDLEPGMRRELEARELDGVSVVAMNVKRLHADGVDPAVFRGRLSDWERRVTSAGATGWQTLADAGRLSGVLAAVR
jgi:hypothetical protein